MKVLVIGGGGREDAMVWALAKSPRVSEVVCAPGNGGIAQRARCVSVDQSSLSDLLRGNQLVGGDPIQLRARLTRDPFPNELCVHG